MRPSFHLPPTASLAGSGAVPPREKFRIMDAQIFSNFVSVNPIE